MMIKSKLIQYLVVIIAIINPLCVNSQNEITSDDIHQLITEASELLNENYVFPDVAKRIEAHLKSQFSKGIFESITTKGELVSKLTLEMQSISHDKHMRCRLINSSIGSENNRSKHEYDYSIVKDIHSFGFARTGKIDGGIGYLEIFGFPSLKGSKESADAAMKTLIGSKALIIDNRRNGGGNPDMIQYICSYLFEKPTHINSIYWRLTDTTVDYVTLDKVDGIKMSHIPIFVLTSNFTFSGGEEFTYDIQTQKRGVIIGEVTGGGANPGDSFSLSNNFAIFIPTGRAINPITHTNWEGVGVKPDIEIDASKALDAAYDKALMITK